MGISNYIEIFRIKPEQKVSDATSNQKSLMTSIFEEVEDLKGVTGNTIPGEVMFRARDNSRTSARLRLRVVQSGSDGKFNHSVKLGIISARPIWDTRSLRLAVRTRPSQG